MEYSHRYRAYPTDRVADRLEHHLDVHRQLYNHVRWDYENSPQDEKPSEYDQNNKLPEWKRKWSVFSELHSKAAQSTVARFHRNLSNLRKKKEKGYNVGRLKRQPPTEYRSVTYTQSGFDLDAKRGHDMYAYVRFSKIGWVKIRYSRPIPDHATIKEVTFKKETTDEWFVSFGLETDDANLPEKSDVDSLDASNSVGIETLASSTTSTRATARPWIGLNSKTTTADSAVSNAHSHGKRRGRTTMRNNVETWRRLSAILSGRCWTISTRLRRGSSKRMMPYSWRTWTSRVCFRATETLGTSRTRRGDSS